MEKIAKTEKHSTSRTIAYCACAAALAALFLSAGYFTQIGEFGWYFLASLPFMLPLHCGMISGSALAFFVSVPVALLFNGFNFTYILPYAVFMGYFPILSRILKKYSAWAAYFIKLVLLEAALYLILRFTGLFLSDNVWIQAHLHPLVAAIGACVLVPYDMAIKGIQKKLGRIADLL